MLGFDNIIPESQICFFRRKLTKLFGRWGCALKEGKAYQDMTKNNIEILQNGSDLFIHPEKFILPQSQLIVLYCSPVALRVINTNLQYVLESSLSSSLIGKDSGRRNKIQLFHSLCLINVGPKSVHLPMADQRLRW